MSILTLRNVSKVYGSGRTALRAVAEVSLEVKAGHVTLIMGPSGSGKTTLLSMMGTLLQASQGEVVIDGSSVSSLDQQQLSKLRLQKIGFIFQASNLLSALTAEQNVALPLRANGTPKAEAHRKAKELLGRFHLEDRLSNLPSNLSGGEKQRVAIARALANDPAIILADEPTASLDSKTGHEVMRFLHDIAVQENRAVVIVSHDLRLRDIATQVITIEDGRLSKHEKVHNHDQDKKT